jgi:CHAD domain-containing protein
MLREISRVRKDASADAIHDLRVATRRLQEALDFFEPCLPSRPLRRLSRRARRIRRELGPVRNADVTLELVMGPGHPPQPGASKALSKLREQLAAEAAALRRNAGPLGGIPVPGARKRCRFLLTGTFPGRFVSLSRRGAVILERRSRKMARRIPPALGGSAVSLHRLRISVKRYRYTLEILQQLGWPGAKPGIATAREIQEQLGQIHDLDVLAALVRRHLRRDAAGPLLRRLLAERKDRSAAFREVLRHFNPKEEARALSRDPEARS